MIWRTGARAALPTAWVAAAVSGGAFAILEPPSAPSPWVGRLVGETRMFRDRLAVLPTLQLDDLEQVK